VEEGGTINEMGSESPNHSYHFETPSFNCAMGKVPAGVQRDGVRLTITGSPEFDEEIQSSRFHHLSRFILGK
jgi:hypothetical protein